MGAVAVDKVEPKKYSLTGSGRAILFGMMGLGVVGLLAGMGVDKDRAWHAYLVSYFYFASLSLGGLFFVAVNHAASAGWSVNIRRFSEAFTAFMPVTFAGGLVLLAGAPALYEWLDADIVARDTLLQGKVAYLNFPFFVVRLVLFTGLWWLFAKKIVGNSVNQDQSGDVSLTHSNRPWSIGFIVVFAVTYSLFSVDLLMSLQPKWFSTIFGVYCFAGLFQSTLAFMILVALFIMKKGLVNGLVTMDHVHDLAKFLKGFTVFWAYIAFSQFMLIWYANLPEETIFFLDRSHGPWMAVSLSLLIFKFIVPFIALLPRWAKRTPGHLASVAVLVLVMQFVDIFWMVFPNYNSKTIALPWMEVLIFIGFLGAFLYFVMGFLGRHNLIPVKDPRIHESLSHHVTY